MASSLVRRSSSLGEIAGESYYHRGDSDDKSTVPRRLNKVGGGRTNFIGRRREGHRSGCGGSSASGAAIVGPLSSSSSPSDAQTTTKLFPPQPQPTEPLLSFGIIADIQYAPIPDGHSYGGQPRYYRNALSTARHAAEHFQRERVDLVVNLGDIIDGKCQDAHELNGREMPAAAATEDDDDGDDGNSNVAAATENPGRDAINEVLSALSAYDHGPTLHTYGNHELYNLDRDELGPLLNIPFVREPCGDLVGYRSHSVAAAGEEKANVRFVVLDSYDVAVGGRCPNTSQKRKQAEELLAAHNPNFPRDENSPEGMEGMQRRYVAFNGAVGGPQLRWLRDTLRDAREANERVILLSHQPILPGSTNSVCLMWNYDEILSVLRDFSCTVVASFSGHAHRGGYVRDDASGIHFRVFEAALESPDPVKTYGFVDVHGDRLEVRGLGDCESAVYDFDHLVIGYIPEGEEDVDSR